VAAEPKHIFNSLSSFFYVLTSNIIHDAGARHAINNKKKKAMQQQEQHFMTQMAKSVNAIIDRYDSPTARLDAAAARVRNRRQGRLHRELVGGRGKRPAGAAAGAAETAAALREALARGWGCKPKGKNKKQQQKNKSGQCVSAMAWPRL
jgi:hypothetical protein